mgnify:CR=1 FL=1
MDIKLALLVAKNNWNDTEWLRNTAIPYGKRTFISGTLKPYYRAFGPSGEDFTEEDWDNLLILDACRYDMFEENCNIEGELRRRKSVGSSTPEFLKETFRGDSFQDIVYVTANPQVNLRLSPGTFHDIISVWKEEWNDELSTVEPSDVTEHAIRAQEQYPNKRLIVHYMQPHYPFIGEKGRNIKNHSGFELTKRLADDKETAKRDYDTVWDQLNDGKMSESVVREAYIENLEIALENIEAELDRFQGRTVITSDHGNLLGEVVTPYGIKMYGHPTGIHADELVTVPWLTIDNGERKTIKEEMNETEAEHSDKEKEIIQERLEDLGYT